LYAGNSNFGNSYIEFGSSTEVEETKTVECPKSFWSVPLE